MTDQTTEQLAQQLDTLRHRMTAAAADQPTPQQLAGWAAFDKNMAARIHKARPGVPLHHAFATLETLRAIQRYEAAGVAPAADQTEPDLLEEYLRHLRGQGTEPDLSDLPPDRCALIAGQFEIVKALADRDPNLPPIEEDPVARRLGLHQAAAGQRIADAMLAVLPDQRAALERAADIAEEVALKRHRQHETEREQGALDVMTELRRMAAGAQQQEPTPVAARESRANESAGSVAGAQQQTDTETRSAPEATAWRGATELAPDRVITALATTGLVGYRQNSGRLLHCLAHKPAPASRYADFHEVTADDLDNGGTCVHPDCGRDLLTPWPTAPVTQQPAAEPRTTWTPGPVAVAQAAEWARQQQAATVDPAMCPRCKGDNSEAFELCGTCAEHQPAADGEEETRG